MKSALLFACLLYSSTSNANIVGSGAQNFNPIPSGLDFVTVHSSETLKPGTVNLGVYLNYAVNSLPYFETNSQNRTTFNDTLTSADFNAAVGIMQNWDVGISFPFTVFQSVSDSTGAFHSEFSKSGLNEVRLTSKYRINGDDSEGFAFIGSVNFNTIKNNPYTGVDPGPTYNIELAYDFVAWDYFTLGFNLGYRYANQGPPLPGSPMEPYGDQIIASAAMSRLIPGTDIKIIGELFGAIPPRPRNVNWERTNTSFETLGGIKYDWTTNLAFHAGAGTELLHGVASPDWRVYTGINYAFEDEEEPTEVWPPPGMLISKPPVAEPPAPGPTPTPEPTSRFTTRSVNFEFDSDKMGANHEKVLADIAKSLKAARPFKKVVIEGHTDSVGGEEYNQSLSLKRAQAIRNFLIKTHGFKGGELEAVGRGESEPVADNGNFQGRSQNRRVEFEVFR